MTEPLNPRPTDPSGGLHDVVATVTGQVARNLVGRYVPVYAVLAALLALALVAPSRIDRLAAPAAEGFLPSSQFAATDDPVATTGAGGTTGPSVPPSSSSAFPTAGTSATTISSDPAPPAVTATARPGGSADGTAADGFAGEPTDEGFGDDVPGCPVPIGEEPEVSREVAAVLLGAASPALSILGPFSPNAIPALGLASPILPVVGPIADTFGPYISLMNPLFLQVSELGTMLWAGPLQPIEGPLLDLNASYVQPFEVALLGAFAEPLDQINATPVTPCLQRLVFNLLAPLPVPTP